MMNLKKPPFLITSSLLFISVSVIATGAAISYGMSRMNSLAPHEYVESIDAANAGMDARTVLLRLHDGMLGFVLSDGKSGIDPQQTHALERRLDADLAAAEGGNLASGMGQFVDDWHDSRMRIVELMKQGQQGDELKIAFRRSAATYDRLEKEVNLLAVRNQGRMEELGKKIERSYAEMITLVWWFLGGTAAFNVLAGVVVIRKAGKMLEGERQTARKLHESEERLKLALSGADEGTWDLDIPSGRLSFDSQWGKILGYGSGERPQSLEEWSKLIDDADRERVLGAMQDHVAGRAAEYRAEYRIRSRTGEMKWVLGQGKAVSFDREGKAVRVVGVTRDVTLRKRAEEEIWNLAHYDSLTGLPNRALFYDTLRQCISLARRRNQKLALLFLDLDGFKEVNDLHGHDTGDGLLKQVALRLRENVREEDIVSRTGGDEFIFILHDIRQNEDAESVARKINAALAQPFVVHGHDCRISGSIGISVFPDDSDDLETLVRQSDHAMYCAKEAGRDSCKFFCEC